MVINIDKLNLVLILISFLLACLLPFELFLFGYAFLGPLHYLTETNWIIGKNYFISNSYWKYLVFIAAFLYSIPFLLNVFFEKSFLEEDSLQKMMLVFNSSHTNILMFLVLVCSIVFLFTQKNKAFLISGLVVLFVSFWAYTSEPYMLINGLMLPTVIHVYIFTILFMLYGMKKKSSTVGKFNILLMFLLPLSLLLINTDVFNYQFSESIKRLYVNNNFHYLNANLAKLFGVYEELKFFFYERIDLKIQIFIAFAYIYHYLNWFSKTTVIGWYNQLNTQKSIIIISVWILISGCYLYDYRIGIVVSIFLSVLHVMLELPLNMITIKSLFEKSKKKPMR